MFLETYFLYVHDPLFKLGDLHVIVYFQQPIRGH